MDVLVGGVVIAAGAIAGNVTLPNIFQPNTPARASEVNANFQAVKTAVDDSQSQITALQARIATLEAQHSTCPANMTKIGMYCVETAVRPAAAHEGAVSSCLNAGMTLCPVSVLLGFCRTTPGTFPSDEWALQSYPTRDGTGMFTVQADQVYVASATHECAIGYLSVNVGSPFRCCSIP